MRLGLQASVHACGGQPQHTRSYSGQHSRTDVFRVKGFLECCLFLPFTNPPRGSASRHRTGFMKQQTLNHVPSTGHVCASLFEFPVLLSPFIAVSTPTISTATVTWAGWPSGSGRGPRSVCSHSAPLRPNSGGSTSQRCRNTNSAAQVRIRRRASRLMFPFLSSTCIIKEQRFIKREFL